MSCESESVWGLAEPSSSVFLTDEHGKRMNVRIPRAFAVDTGARGIPAPAADRANIEPTSAHSTIGINWGRFHVCAPKPICPPSYDVAACRMSETVCGLK